MVDVSLAEAPVLKEGVQTSVKVHLKNQSTTPTDAGLVVSLNSTPGLLEILQQQVKVGVLAAGEERVVEFPVIARASGASVDLPITLEADLGSGRRVGALSTVQEVPLQNDYRIDVTSALLSLRASGVTRVQYTITNVSSRLLMARQAN